MPTNLNKRNSKENSQDRRKMIAEETPELQEIKSDRNVVIHLWVGINEY